MPDEIVCPFCPLHCDDLQLRDSTVDVHCEIAEREFASHLQQANAPRGVQAAALPSVPIVQVIQPTIEEAKKLQQWVQENRIRLHSQRPAMDQAIAVTRSRDGAMSATLGDVLKHAKFIWVIGDTQTRLPRLLEKLKRSGALVRTDRLVDTNTLSQLIALADAAAEEIKPTQEEEAETIAESVATFASNMPYTAVVVGDGAFDQGSETVSTELLGQLINRWNTPENDDTLRRAVLLRLGEDESLTHVVSWRTNAQSPPGWTDAKPHVRLGNPPAGSESVILQIGGTDPGTESASAYLPGGIPGIDCQGTVVRGDGSVTLPLATVLDRQVPSRIEALESRLVQR